MKTPLQLPKAFPLFKKAKTILFLLLILASSLRSYATISNDKTLFVDFFGFTIFRANEDGTSGSTTFERQNELIAYATANGFETLILKRLDGAKTGSGSGDPALFPISSVNTFTTSMTGISRYDELANFIKDCRTAGITHIAAGDEPFNDPYDPPAVTTHSYSDNKFFDNIIAFNAFYRNTSTGNIPNGYFDMLYGEFDYWPGPYSNMAECQEIKTEWDYYIDGLTYIRALITSNPVVPGTSTPILLATYIGDLTKVTKATTFIHNNTPVSPPPIEDEQDQADAIDALIDWLYVAFYFDGDQLDNATYPHVFFTYDDSKGRRLQVFARTNKNTVVIPFFSSSAGFDTPSYNSAQMFFGDYLDYANVNANGNPYFASGTPSWHGTIDDLTTLFEAEYTTTNPYNLPSTTTPPIEYYLTMKELCETGSTGAHPLTVAYPNKTSVNGEGTAWFKYSTMPDARYFLTSEPMGTPLPTEDAYWFDATVTNPSVTVSADELFTTGSGTICSPCRTFDGTTGLSTEIMNYKWYYNGSVLASCPSCSTITMTPLTSGDTYVTAEIEVATYKSSAHTNTNRYSGGFDQIRIRKSFRLEPDFSVLSTGPYYFYIDSYTSPTCPNYNNGTAKIFYTQSNPGNDFCYYYYRNGSSTACAIGNVCNGYTVTGLLAGSYVVKLYSGTVNPITCAVTGPTDLNKQMSFTLSNSLALPQPHIIVENPDYSCYPSLHVSGGYSSCVWKRDIYTTVSTSATCNATTNGSYTVTVTSGGCTATSPPLEIKYNPTPAISGSSIACETNKKYIVSNSPNDVSFSWTVPSGVTYTEDGNSITITSWGALANTGGTISCDVTNICGQTGTANKIVLGCCSTATGDLNNATIGSTPVSNLTGSFHINGTLNIINSGTCVTIDAADVSMNKNAVIYIAAGCTLKIINSSHLHACGSDMWVGIQLEADNSIVEVTGSKIEDAMEAIYSVSNGIVRIDNAAFNANFIHLFLVGDGSSNSSYIRNGSSFTCKNGSGVNAVISKSPYSGNRTGYGIMLSKFGSMTIGASTGSRNIISNTEFGVYSSESEVTIMNTDFDMVETGYLAEIGSLNVQVCNFSNCQTCILGQSGTRVEVSGSSFEEATYGIVNTQNFGVELFIHENYFHNIYGFAIQHIANDGCGHEIYNNTILYEGGDDIHPHGIEVVDLSPEGGGSLSSGCHIYNNDIYNTAFGIHIQSLSRAEIFDNLHNEVQHTPDDIFSYGILAEYCYESLIQNNSVSSYGYSMEHDWWNSGIMADNSPDTRMLCNSVGNVGRGLWIGGESPNTILAGNIMGDCYDQVYLNWNFMGLGDQGGDASMYPSAGLAYDNEWVGNPYSPYGHQTTSYYSNNLDVGGYSKFYTRLGSPYEPTDHDVIPIASVFDVCYTISLTDFEAEPYCTARPELPEDRDVEERIAQNIYDSYFETLNFMSKEYLLKKSKSDPTLAANSISIANEVTQLELGNIGLIAEIKDSISVVNLDSTETVLIQQVEQLNNALHPISDVEINYKAIHELNLSFTKNHGLSNTEQIDVVNLAEQCPYAAGPAVYMARTLRALFDRTPHQYTSACETYNPFPASRKAKVNSVSSSLFGTRLYPSPNNGNAIYEFAVDKDALVKIKVFDGMGKLMLFQNLTGKNKFEFQSLNLSQGLYHIQLFVNDQLSDDQNMVVVK